MLLAIKLLLKLIFLNLKDKFKKKAVSSTAFLKNSEKT